MEGRHSETDPRWWDAASFEGRPVADLLAERDVCGILRFLRTRGFSRTRLAAVTGLSETRVRQIAQGRQRVTSYEVLERIADGLGIPRHLLGLGSDSGNPEADLRGALTDPLLHDAWADLLRVLSARSNTEGCADLRGAAEGQSRLIASARVIASGPARARLMTIEARWTEFRSWIEANSHQPTRAEPLLDSAYSLAVEAGDQHLAAYILMRKSQQALDDGDAVRAVRLAQQARQARQLPPRTSALCLVREAEGHAMADDAVASRESINLAIRLVSAPEDTVDDLGGHCTVEYVRASEARCRQLLGESAAATRAYEEVLLCWPQGGRLDEGMWRADLALAYLDDDESERAAAAGLSAVQVAAATSSARTLRAVGRLLPRLRRHRDLPAVRDLADAYRVAVGAVTIGA